MRLPTSSPSAGKNQEQLQNPIIPKLFNRHALIFFVAGLLTGFVLSLQFKNLPLVLQAPVLYQTPQISSLSDIKSSNYLNGSYPVFFDEHRLSLKHNMTDQELFLAASKVPSSDANPKVAFMFLTKGRPPLAQLWEKFFQGHQGFFSIYVHPHPSSPYEFPETSVFHGRRIPSQPVYWGTPSMVDAERRLLGNALLDPSNQRFALLSDSCIPLFNFTSIYNYLVGSTLSFIASVDDPRKVGRGRYNHRMAPHINISDWRKGSQWFVAHREIAFDIVTDTKLYPVFVDHCHPPCYMDEHYIPTLASMRWPRKNSNRSLTWVDWSKGGPHPNRFVGSDLTEEFLTRVRFGKKCTYSGAVATRMCHLFARKFPGDALKPLLRLGPWRLGSGPYCVLPT